MRHTAYLLTMMMLCTLIEVKFNKLQDMFLIPKKIMDT